MRQYGVLIRFFYKVNPDELDDDEFCRYQAEIHYLSELGLIDIEFNGKSKNKKGVDKPTRGKNPRKNYA